MDKISLISYGNAFWEKSGFAMRDDLVYRNKSIVEMVRIDTQP